MLSSQSYRRSHFWILFLFLSFILLFRLAATPIYILDEAKNAECAREMLQRNDFVTPTFNGELRTDKPPLHYFFMIAAYKILGVNEFGARFFSAIMGLLTVLVTFFYTKKSLDEFTAFCTALVLIASTHFLFEFRLAVPDPYLIFFITLGLFAAFAWLQKKEALQLYISAASLSLAALAKGPVAIALPGLCVLLWVIIKKKWNHLFTWHLFFAFLVLCIITLPWYYAVHKATNGEWTKGFFIGHNINRLSAPQEGHGGIFLITTLFVLIGLLPFISFTGEVIKHRKHVFQNDLVKFSAVIVIVFVVFFSISSTRLPNYPMPCYPFAALILGNYLAALLNKRIDCKQYPYYILLLFTAVLPAAGYFAISSEKETKELSWLSLLLLITPLIFMIFLSKKNDWNKKIISIFFAFFIFNMIGLHYIYPALYKQNPVAKTLQTVTNYSNICAYGIFNPGYRFYLDKNIPHTFDVSTLKSWLYKRDSVLVITRSDYLDSIKHLPLQEIATHHDIFELPTTVILKKTTP